MIIIISNDENWMWVTSQRVSRFRSSHIIWFWECYSVTPDLRSAVIWNGFLLDRSRFLSLDVVCLLLWPQLCCPSCFPLVFGGLESSSVPSLALSLLFNKRLVTHVSMSFRRSWVYRWCVCVCVWFSFSWDQVWYKRLHVLVLHDVCKVCCEMFVWWSESQKSSDCLLK